jgi:hypothetical protein
MGGVRGPVELRSEGPEVTGAPLCAKCSNAYCLLGSLVVRIVGVCSSCEPGGSVVVCWINPFCE